MRFAILAGRFLSIYNPTANILWAGAPSLYSPGLFGIMFIRKIPGPLGSFGKRFPRASRILTASPPPVCPRPFWKSIRRNRFTLLPPSLPFFFLPLGGDNPALRGGLASGSSSPGRKRYPRPLSPPSKGQSPPMAPSHLMTHRPCAQLGPSNLLAHRQFKPAEPSVLIPFGYRRQTKPPGLLANRQCPRAEPAGPLTNRQ